MNTVRIAMFEGYNDIVTVGEAAEMLRTKPYRIYKLIQDGLIHRLNIGKPFVIPKSEVIRFSEENLLIS